MGFLVVPSQYVRPIVEKMLELMQATIDLVPEHYYYAGQLTVTRALSELDIQANHLPNTYNWLDTHAPINLENVFFLHYLKNREKIVSYYNMGNNANQYLYTINQVAKNVFRPRKIFL